MAAVPAILGGAAFTNSIVQSVAAAEFAEAQEKQQAIRNRDIAVSAANQYGDLIPAQFEAIQTADDDSLAAQAEFIRQRGEVLLLAGASGTQGNAVDSMLFDLREAKGRNISQIIRDKEKELDNINLQKRQIQARAQASLGTQIFQRPTAFGTLFSALGAGGQGFLQGQAIARSLK